MSRTVLVIPGKCIPKGRPRFTMDGNVYTPKRTADYEDLVKTTAKLNIKEPIEGPLKVTIIVEQKMPKSWSKKRKQRVIDGEELVMSVQDLDNMVKSVTDGLNKIAYKDDRQIIRIVAEKKYSEVDQVIAVIEPYDPNVKRG